MFGGETRYDCNENISSNDVKNICVKKINGEFNDLTKCAFSDKCINYRKNQNILENIPKNIISSELTLTLTLRERINKSYNLNPIEVKKLISKNFGDSVINIMKFLNKSYSLRNNGIYYSEDYINIKDPFF